MSADCWGIAFLAGLVAIHFIGPCPPQSTGHAPRGRSVFRLLVAVVVDVCDDDMRVRHVGRGGLTNTVVSCPSLCTTNPREKAWKHVPCFLISLALRVSSETGRDVRYGRSLQRAWTMDRICMLSSVVPTWPHLSRTMHAFFRQAKPLATQIKQLVWFKFI